MISCCICFCLCCQSAHYNQTLVVTPSELILVGATKSDLRVANITSSVLKDSGTTPSQIRQLALIDSCNQKQTEKKPKFKDVVKFEQQSLSDPDLDDNITDTDRVGERDEHIKGQEQDIKARKQQVKPKSNVDLFANKLKNKTQLKKDNEFESKSDISEKNKNNDISLMEPNKKMDEIKLTDDTIFQ